MPDKEQRIGGVMLVTKLVNDAFYDCRTSYRGPARSLGRIWYVLAIAAFGYHGY